MRRFEGRHPAGGVYRGAEDRQLRDRHIPEWSEVPFLENGAWDNLHERFEMKRINPEEAYSLNGACANQAEEYFSHLRRAGITILRGRACSATFRKALGGRTIAEPRMAIL
jgi:hypothetical protein